MAKSKSQVDKGIFNLQSMFNEFMKYKPGENDDQGRAIKQTTMADAFNTALQSELAKGMADYQSGIAKEQMQMQQNLERQAAGEARKEEFNYGMQSMGAQFEHQNNYANAQFDRDIGISAAQGEQQRKNICC